MGSVFLVPLHFNVKSFVYENIFSNHLLSKQHVLPQLKTNNGEIWPSLYLLVCLALLTLIKLRAFPRVVKIIQSVYSTQTLQQLEREEPNQFKLYTIALNVFFVLNLAFLIYKINLAYKFVFIQSPHFSQFLAFILLVIVLYGIKYLGNKLLAIFSGEERLIHDYETSSNLINQASGLFLFPWIVMAQFSKFNPLIFVSGALITMLASVLVKWYRGIVVCLVEERVGLLQIFSYFCGLEILPLTVMVKYVIETF